MSAQVEMKTQLTLSELANLAGTDEGINLGRKGDNKDKKPFVSPFETNVAYPITITEDEVVTSKNGYLQAQLKVAIGHGENPTPAGRIWLSLPIFTAEMAQSQGVEKLESLKEIFGEKFHSFLRSFDGSFKLFSNMVKDGKKWTFFGPNGEELSTKAKVAREKEVGKAVIGAAKALYSGEMSLKGKQMFYVRVQDNNNPNKTYDQFYSVAPDKYPVFQG